MSDGTPTAGFARRSLPPPPRGTPPFGAVHSKPTGPPPKPSRAHIPMSMIEQDGSFRTTTAMSTPAAVSDTPHEPFKHRTFSVAGALSPGHLRASSLTNTASGPAEPLVVRTKSTGGAAASLLSPTSEQTPPLLKGKDATKTRVMSSAAVLVKTPATSSSAITRSPSSNEGISNESNNFVAKLGLRHVELPTSPVKDATSPATSTLGKGKRNQNEKDLLFEYVLVVGLSEAADGSGKKDSGAAVYVPTIQYRYPPASDQEYLGKKETSLLASIPQFCFPDAHMWRPVRAYVSDTFSFVLTEIDSSKRFGYCRRLLPDGDGSRLPEVYCIISRAGSFSLFSQILDIVEARRKHSSSSVFAFLKSVAAIPFPDPGESAVVKAFTPGGSGMEEYTLSRPNDLLMLEHVSFTSLFTSLGVQNVLHIFCSLLLERRIIFASRYLSKLSEIANAVLALLYPFEWQHIIIPILPVKLLDFCCSPTPFVVGVLSDNIPAINKLPIDEALIIDIDAGCFLRQDCNDWASVGPTSLLGQLEKRLRPLVDKQDAQASGADSTHGVDTFNEAVCEAFLHFMVELMARYRNYFHNNEKDDTVQFSTTDFLASARAKDVRKMREAFTQSQMFHVFIHERETALTNGSDNLDNPSSTQVELFEHAVDLAESSGDLSKSMQLKQLKSGIKVVKGRFKKLVKLAKKAASAS